MPGITWTDEEFESAVQKALEKALKSEKEELEKIREQFLSQAKSQQQETLKEFDQPLTKLKTDAEKQLTETETRLEKIKTDAAKHLDDCDSKLEKFKADAKEKQKELSEALNVKLVGVISGVLLLVTLAISGYLGTTSFNLYTAGKEVERETIVLRERSKLLGEELDRTKKNFGAANLALTGDPGSPLALLHNLVNEKQRQLDEIAGKVKRLDKIDADLTALRSAIQRLQPKLPNSRSGN